MAAAAEHHRAGEAHEPALVVPVDDDAGPGAEEQRRGELDRREQAERGAAVGEAVDEQRLGGELDPGAGEADALGDEEDPEVAVLERPEGVGGGELEAGSPLVLLPVEPLDDGDGLGEGDPLGLGEAGEALGEPGVAAPVRPVEERPAVRGELEPGDPLVVGAAGAGSTRPRSSRPLASLVAIGGVTFSAAARSPRVIGPRRLTDASADIRLGVMPSSTFVRSWRTSGISAWRKRAARSAASRSDIASPSL